MNYVAFFIFLFNRLKWSLTPEYDKGCIADSMIACAHNKRGVKCIHYLYMQYLLFTSLLWPQKRYVLNLFGETTKLQRNCVLIKQVMIRMIFFIQRAKTSLFLSLFHFITDFNSSIHVCSTFLDRKYNIFSRRIDFYPQLKYT